NVGDEIGARQFRAEQFLAQREAAGLDFGIVEAQLAAIDFEVLTEPSQRIGQADRAGNRKAGDDLSERALAEDVGKEFLTAAALAAEQTGLVIVSLGGQINVAGGQVKLGAIFLQRIILEDAERHVVVAGLLRRSRDGAAESDAFFGKAQALGER